MICKNCGHSFDGNFCNDCGQSATVRRIDFKFLIHEIPNSIFHFNRGLFYTVKELSTRPGHTIREFVVGKRIQNYKPISYFLVASALYVIATHLMGRNTFIADFVSGFTMDMAEQDQSSGSEVINWIAKNQTYITLLFIPLFSFASYIAFIKTEYNYFEHLVLNLYITGQQMLIYLIFSFVITKDSILTVIPILMGMTYNIWAYFQFFDNKKNINKALLILMTYIFVIVELFVILFMIVGIMKINR
jgi:hypothetical protein